MTVQAVPRSRLWRGSRSLWVVLASVALLMAAAGTFVSYVLWPSWPKSAVPLDAPAMPVTVAGVLFNVPPAAIRAAVQRNPGAHERIDLVFLWPSLAPPAADGRVATKMSTAEGSDAIPTPRTDDRVFVTIAALGMVLPPAVRLRTIYPRYIEPEATAGPDGLAIVAFRAGTPYEGDDLVYLADKPEQFFALCSRPLRTVPGTCIQERSLDAAEITLRFSREWLEDWRNAAVGLDRLVAQLHAAAN
jgi:hypothetical protein